jgi:serine/threonine protein kinase
LQQANIAHRDIKPGNLYELNGSWLIGDFGLVALPDAEPLTVEGRQVGPAHYTAYEMILNPTTADPHPADVYSLGKTLWVLATDQKWPPEGHQPSGSRGFDIGDFRPHARAGALDREVDLMTQLHPERRPTKDPFESRCRYETSLVHQEGAPAERFDLFPESLRDAFDCELGGGVGAVDWDTGEIVDRGDVDDGALPPAPHSWQAEPHQLDRGKKVDFERGQIGCLILLNGTQEVGSVVDQHVD